MNQAVANSIALLKSDSTMIDAEIIETRVDADGTINVEFSSNGKRWSFKTNPEGFDCSARTECGDFVCFTHDDWMDIFSFSNKVSIHFQWDDQEEASISLERFEDGISDEQICDKVFSLQGNSFHGTKIFDDRASMCAGDIVQIEDRFFWCAAGGWTKITHTDFIKWQQMDRFDRHFGFMEKKDAVELTS